MNSFLKSLPGPFKKNHEVLTSFGLTPIVVGGIPRNFIMKSQVGKDWDIEVTSGTVAWSKDLWKQLARALESAGKVTILPYEIIRVDCQENQFEFSPPRIEVYFSDWQERGHSNFEAHFDLKLPFEKSVERRDFTVNSIGFRMNSLKEIEVLDPFEGVRHIHEKILHPSGKDFRKDPIRFLRAFRFRKNLGFEFSSVLENTLSEMKMSKLPHAHLWAEMKKSSDPLGLYLELARQLKVHPEMALPLGQEILQAKEEFSRVLIDPCRHESWIIAMVWAGIDFIDWQEHFLLGKDFTKRLSRWASSTKKFIDIRPENFHGDFEKIRDLPDFELLFDWYFTTRQLLQKNSDLPLLKMIQEFVPDWIHLYKFEPVKDVKHIDPPYRAKYQVWNLCQRL